MTEIELSGNLMVDFERGLSVPKRKNNNIENGIQEVFDWEAYGDDGTEFMSPAKVLTGSNALWKSKFRTNLFLQKLSDLCLSCITETPDGSLIARVSVSQVRNFTGVSGNGLYEQLKNATESLMSRYIVFEDEENHRFAFINIIEAAGYDDGYYTIQYNKFIKNHLFGLTEHYTTLKLDTLGKWTSVYTYKMYVFLSTTVYLLEYNPIVKVNFSIGELRAEVGSIDAKDKKVIGLINKGYSWNQVADIVKDDMIYPTWKQFKEKVLNRAQQEINGSVTSEFCIEEMNPIKEGKAHKVVSVDFILKKNPNYNGYRPSAKKREPISEEELKGIKINLVPTVRQIFNGAKITDREALGLLREANNDIEKIEKAFNYVRKQPEVHNLVGYVRMAIRNNCWGDGTPIPSYEGETLEGSAIHKKTYDEHIAESERIHRLVEKVWMEELTLDELPEKDRKIVKKLMEVDVKLGNDWKYYRKAAQKAADPKSDPEPIEGDYRIIDTDTERTENPEEENQSENNAAIEQFEMHPVIPEEDCIDTVDGYAFELGYKLRIKDIREILEIAEWGIVRAQKALYLAKEKNISQKDIVQFLKQTASKKEFLDSMINYEGEYGGEPDDYEEAYSYDPSIWDGDDIRPKT